MPTLLSALINSTNQPDDPPFIGIKVAGYSYIEPLKNDLDHLPVFQCGRAFSGVWAPVAIETEILVDRPCNVYMQIVDGATKLRRDVASFGVSRYRDLFGISPPEDDEYLKCLSRNFIKKKGGVIMVPHLLKGDPPYFVQIECSQAVFL